MSTTGNYYTNILLASYNLADLICSAINRNAYAAMMAIGPDGLSFVSLGGWCGGVYIGETRAPYMANAKAAELLWLGDKGELSLTPVKALVDKGLSVGYRGGARLGEHIVGVSKWEEEHDLLLALIALYSLEWETRLHHIGWRMPTETAWREASEKESVAGYRSVELPAPDHCRMYHWHPDARSDNGGFHTEYQFFPDGPQTPAVHIDVAVNDPDRFLRFIAKAFDAEPTIWGDEAPKPYGAVWVTAKGDGSMMGVMARDRWDYFVPNIPADRVDAQRPRMRTSRP